MTYTRIMLLVALVALLAGFVFGLGATLLVLLFGNTLGFVMTL